MTGLASSMFTSTDEVMVWFHFKVALVPLSVSAKTWPLSHPMYMVPSDPMAGAPAIALATLYFHLSVPLLFRAYR